MRLYVCKTCGVVVPYRYSSPNQYCSNKCQAEFGLRNRFDKWMKGEFHPLPNQPTSLKRLVIMRDGYKCSICGISKWNSKSIALELEHKNGNFQDNCQENVGLMCPNCHSQTDTFRGRNKKGNGRFYFRMRYRKSLGLPLED